MERADKDELQILLKRVTRKMNRRSARDKEGEWVSTPPEVVTTLDKNLFFKPNREVENFVYDFPDALETESCKCGIF